jgi:hypothetical protein
MFGPDIGALKRKSTRKVPVPVKTDEIEIPTELKERHQDLTLCIDIVFVIGMRKINEYRSFDPFLRAYSSGQQKWQSYI